MEQRPARRPHKPKVPGSNPGRATSDNIVTRCTVPTMQWEITYVQASTNSVQSMIDAANTLGAEGWEPVGITSADRTLGLNTNVLIFKRPLTPPPPPTSDDEWQDDPTGRFDKRRWNGKVWTAQTAMMEAKTLHVDPPST